MQDFSSMSVVPFYRGLFEGHFKHLQPLLSFKHQNPSRETVLVTLLSKAYILTTLFFLKELRIGQKIAAFQ